MIRNVQISILILIDVQIVNLHIYIYIYTNIIIYTYLKSVLNLLLMNVQIVHEGMTIYDDYLLLIIY